MTIGLFNVSMDDHGDQILSVVVNGSLNVNQLKPFSGQIMLPTDLIMMACTGISMGMVDLTSTTWSPYMICC